MDLISNLQTTLSAAYTHDTSVKIEVDSVTNFPADGVVRIDDDDEWVLQRYDVVDAGNDELETLTDPKIIFESSGAVDHEFAIGTTVTLVFTGDYLDEIAAATPVLANGTVPLTANWDAGAFRIIAETFESDIPTGNPPFVVASTTVVPNLNADQVDGHDWATVILADGTQGLTAAWDAGSYQIQALTFKSDVVTGTAPLTVASTTVVPNLNVDMVDGKHSTDFLLLDGTQVMAATLDMNNNALSNVLSIDTLSAAELGELANIGATTISAAQWGYLGAQTGEALEVDGTAGRTIRMATLVVDDGTVGPTLKCTLASQWNGDAIAETDNIPKGGAAGDFALNAPGDRFVIKASGLSGNALGVLCVMRYNTSGTDFLVDSFVSGNDIIMLTLNRTTGAAIDMTGLVDVGQFIMHVLYVTDA